jgi:hypothetical protein
VVAGLTVFGGMAAIVKRAVLAEAACWGQSPGHRRQSPKPLRVRWRRLHPAERYVGQFYRLRVAQTCSPGCG